MARKPIHLEMKGGKTPRQRIWEAVRANRKRFTQAEIAEVVGGLEENIGSVCARPTVSSAITALKPRA
ncbi:hypothetical protein OR16_31579 [Cupriavidus basilensis OR16]|uniref:Uncharacterized protein n=1 Tax=Cupriavidus basilensis OR16 TaxID=1127483 RepID=H1SDL0_9BURK|nr:hypothetical protein OR16_31579 [Cupriavidus basilensis OR16]